MRYVLDASVAVAFLRPTDANHPRVLKFMQKALSAPHDLLVPAIFRVEVAAALARASIGAGDVDRLMAVLLARAEVVTLGPKAARKAAHVAIACRLRGMDAIYVWVAQREGAPLVTLDREVCDRAAKHCELICPP
jgi:predicted nucleic acid-binding protein